ncbi:MAG: decaprenyl-phosphate phosphoribosyltransferase, partial [Candidatus Thermoplasmatota archaeon]|nr:decaprenyl-phosphate phosphoribosyltransferase [Candidatus Thermoplasmatota archaeon]
EMRIRQWYKNAIVFIALIFSGNALNYDMYPQIFLAFGAFCLVSSATYIINDIIDRKKDLKHPSKRNRPIASGRIGVIPAAAIAIFLYSLGIIPAVLFLSIATAWMLVAYVATSLLYDFYFRNIPIVDVVVISFGFVYRALAGATAISVKASPWLVMVTFLLALFLAIAKRRHELSLLKEDAAKHRMILGTYSVQLLDSMLLVTSASVIMSYAIYTSLSAYPYMMITNAFVFVGVFRYFQMTYVNKFIGEAEMIFKDRLMLADIALWAVSTVSIIAGLPEKIAAALGA